MDAGKRNTLKKLATFMIAALTMLSSAAMAEESKAEKQQLFLDGARLWPVYCSQCHNARPGSEFSPAQWDAIMMHMRTQSNMPARDARAIKEYLKGGR
jgi:mono/diheme cytochrome c family protein